MSTVSKNTSVSSVYGRRIAAYVTPNYASTHTHSWNADGICTDKSCNKKYKDCDSKSLNTASKTSIPGRLYKVSKQDYVYCYPNGKSNTKVSDPLAAGRYVYVLGTDNGYYKIQYGGDPANSTAYIRTSSVTTYTKSSSPSEVKVSLEDFSIKPKSKHALHGTVSSKNPLKQIKASVRGKVNLSSEVNYSNAIWVRSNLNNTGIKLNNDLQLLSTLPEGVYDVTVTATDVFDVTDTGTAVLTVGGVQPPTISDAEGGEESLKVKITTNHKGGTTVYTVNGGEEQTLSGTSGQITVTEEGDTVITAKTTKDGNSSSKQTKTVTLKKLEPPVIDVEQQGDKGKITLSSSDSKATIRYKKDSEPYQSYEGPFNVSNGVVITAYAEKPGAIRSDVAKQETEYTEPDAPVLKLLNADSTIATGRTATIGWSRDWKAESYEVTLYRGEEEVEKITTDKLTASFTLPTAGDYYVEATAGNALGESTASNRVELKAKDPLTVTFRDAGAEDEGGEILAELKVAYGDKPEKIADPSRRGHTFIGWEDPTTGRISLNEYLQTPVKGDVTYYAAYEKKTYSVKFYDPDSKLIATKTVAYEEDGVTDDIETALRARGFITEGKAVTGWSVIRVSDNESKADVHSVDSDMDVQAIISWENEDLPVRITISSVSVSGTTFKPTVRIVTDETRDTDIYLVASLKGRDEKSGVEKTLYSDRRVFVIPAGELGIVLNGNGSSHSLDLKVGSTNTANAVTKCEIVALERKDNERTGSTYSEVATCDVVQETGWTEGEWSTTKPEEKENRIIETKTQYKYRDKTYTYNGNDTLSGYTKESTEYYNFATSKWQSGAYTKYGAYATAAPTKSTNVTAGYKDVNSYATTTAYWSYAYVSGNKDWYWTNTNGTSRSGQKTSNLLNVYSSVSLAKSGYSQDTDKSYALPKTISTTSPGKMGTIYRIDYAGTANVNTFTSGTANTWLWANSTATRALYRATTVRTRNKFWKWGDWSGWSDSEYTASSTREVETRTLYKYSDKIEAPPVVTDLDGTVVHLSGRLDVEADLEGKNATIMVYQTNNTDPNKYQMQYTGQIKIGANNSYDFSFIPKEEPTTESGNYIVTLGVEGTTGLVTVGVVEAPKVKHNVTVSYVDGEEERVLSEQVVEDGGDVDLSGITLPEKEGYYFTGWSQRTTNIKESCTIRAEYLPMQSTVVFVDWVKQTIEMKTALSGETIDVPEAPEDSEGYHFKGWKTEDGTMLDGSIKVAGNIIVTADYDLAEFTVTFRGTDGSVVDTQTVGYGRSAEPPAYTVPADQGSFIGWSTFQNWWNVTADVDVYPVISYKETAERPTAVIIRDEETNIPAVHLSTEEESADIYYSVDGTVPTEDLIAEYERSIGSGEAVQQDVGIQKYTEPLTFEEEQGITAVTYAVGKNESEACYVYYDPEQEGDEYEDTLNDWEEVGTYDVKVKAGKAVSVSVDLEENPGLVGYDFIVEGDRRTFYADTDEYDEPIISSGTVSGSGRLSASVESRGWRMVWNADRASTESGNLFTLTLHADEDTEEGTYPITVSYAPENTLDEEWDPTLLKHVKVSVDSEASIRLENLDISLSRTSYEYEGTALEPTVKIEGLKEGEDFSVVYENNIDVGTAKAIVTGMGDYAGTVEKEFTITQANIANADMEAIPDQVMTGSVIEPELVLSYNGTALERDKDYEVSYDKNVSIGTAEVTISGKGNFRGSKAATFEITETLESQIALLKKELEESEQARQDAEARIAELTAAKEAAEQNAADLQAQYDEAAAEVGRLTDEKAALEAEAEANAEKLAEIEKQLSEAEAAKKTAEEDLAAANEEKARLEGDLEAANSAKEAAEKRAEEAEKALEEAQQGGTPDKKISLNSAAVAGIEDMTYTGQALTQELKVTLDGKELIADTDYAVTYSSNVDVGQATLTISGKGSYEGSVSETFRILPKGTTVSKLTKAKKGFTVKWKKQSAKMSASRITGYQIQYSTKKDFSSGRKTSTVKGYKKTSKKVSKLKAKKKYYVRIRTYMTVDGTKYWSEWSPVKSVKTK